MNPAARARGVREWNHQRFPARVLDDAFPADERGQRERRKKSLDREPAHWNQQLRPNDSQLILQPVRAALLLIAIWDAVPSAAWMRAWITARDGGDVDLLARSLFIDSRAREPAKQRFSGTAGERHSTFRLDFSGRLPDQHDSRVDSAGYHRPDAVAQLATLTAGKGVPVPVERERGSHYRNNIAGQRRGEILHSSPSF